MTQNSEIISVAEPSDLKVRSILGEPECHLNFKPFIKEVENYVKDSTDFLNKYKQEVCKNAKIITFCVGSLYRSLPHNLSIEAKNYYLTNYETNLHLRFTKVFVSESVEFIFKNNTLTYQTKHFLQIQGKAMSTIIYLFIYLFIYL